MLARTAAARATAQLAARRALHTTPARLSSPYHYPEGPLSNLPFNPRKRGPGFTIAYWSFCATGFGLPFGIAGTYSISFFFFVCITAWRVLGNAEGGLAGWLRLDWGRWDCSVLWV